MPIPITEIEFDAQSKVIAAPPFNPASRRHVAVLCHGWNNDAAEARALYAAFLACFEKADPAAASDTTVLACFWPSKKFGTAQAPPLNNLDQFVREIGAQIQSHADPAQISPEEGLATIAHRAALPGGGAAILRAFSLPVGLDRTPPTLLTGIERLLNFATYYEMKDRAGLIGREGLNPFLARLQAQSPSNLRLHLIGHSFGGRLVTAAADGPNPLRLDTLILLQAAYSHNGLAENFDGRGKNGFFHRVLRDRKISGPILITHSKNDEALSLAYPLASRLNGDDAAAIGLPSDLYGGMGANGARGVNALEAKLYDPYDLSHPVVNLNGDAIIQSHGDVARPETAALLSLAIKRCAD
jgi:pimeloyl-ACP methyl ester carboxylesterase